MSSNLWEPDRHLTLEIARSVIGTAFSDIDVGTLQLIGSGWEFDAFRTADDWLFRFPRRAEAQELFQGEAPILKLARKHLPSGTAVPRVERFGQPCKDFPSVFAGHRFIHGAPADTVPPHLHATLAASIGDVLGAVHSVPIEAARAAGLSELDRPEEDRRIWFENGLAGVSGLQGMDPVLDDAIQWVRELDDPLRRLDGPLHFIHHDISPEHILVDPHTGHISGVIDWTDAILGDPARDFVTLVAFGGWGFVKAVLSNYGPGVDAGFHDRLRFMAKLLAVMWLGYAHAKGEDVSKHMRWVRNCYTETDGS